MTDVIEVKHEDVRIICPNCGDAKPLQSFRRKVNRLQVAPSEYRAEEVCRCCWEGGCGRKSCPWLGCPDKVPANKRYIDQRMKAVCHSYSPVAGLFRGRVDSPTHIL